MSRWTAKRSAAMRLSIDADGWRLDQAGHVLACARADSLDALVTALDEARVQRARKRPLLLASVHERWVRTFTVEPARGLRSLRELQALAAARAEHLFGTDARAWRLRGEWQASRTFVVTALPEVLARAVERLARRYSLRLAALVPAWVQALAEQPATRGVQWWAIKQAGAVTITQRENKRACIARSVRVAPDAAEDALVAIAQREQLRLVSAGARTGNLRWLDATNARGAVRQDAAAAHDARDLRGGIFALPPLHRAVPAALVAAGLIALAATGIDRWHALDEERAALDHALAPVQTERPAPTAAPTVATVRNAGEVEAFNVVARRLNTPWPELFAALERATPREIALVALEPDTRQARLRGSGRASDHRTMVDYVERLAAQPTFAAARLVRHEFDAKDASRPLKFQFEVALATTP